MTVMTRSSRLKASSTRSVDHPEVRSAFLNHRNDKGRTAMHEAAIAGHAGIYSMLLHAGADPGIVDLHGKIAAEYLVERTRL